MENRTHIPIKKEYLVDNVLMNESVDLPADVEKMMRLLRRAKVRHPAVFVGTASSGVISGAGDTLDEIRKYLDERNIRADVVETGSAGYSSMEPVVEVQMPGKTRVAFRNVTAGKLSSVLDGIFNSIIPEEHVLGQHRDRALEIWKDVPFIDELPFFSLQKRNLLRNWGRISPLSIEEYIATGGYRSYVKTVRSYTHEEVCDIVEKSGLQGRGGGGFLTGKKWKVAHSVFADQRYLLCNADESDPGGYANRAMIESDPHRLLEGVLIAAYAIGTSRALIYIRNDYRIAIERLEHAISQAREFGLIGHNVYGSGFNIEITVRKGPGAFVCGEETAMISSLEGKRGMPRPKPPYPAVSGLFGKPTVVNNVETLSNIPAIFENGPDWFMSIGNESARGTKILVLSGIIVNQGIIEVPLGTPVKDIIYGTGEGIPDNKTFKAVQIGGPSGGFLTSENIDTPYDFSSLASEGVYMGSGGMVVLDESCCIIDTVKYFMDFIQKESCGKCIPCREGTSRMLEVYENITRRPVDANGHTTLERFKGVMQLESLAGVISDTSLCGLGQKAPNTVTSSLRHFRSDYEEHIFDRECSAGVCKELRLFQIDVNKCTGCTVCAPKCPESAIIGTRHHPFFIVEEKCTGCGICYDVCKFSAIYVK
ncbi:MAG: NADH-quinone oxidoreductase subunit F [Marinilabiliales bacterium]|nr:MAG: NADH-quinone oxidoreductase subunit F [Marinilabiliales bacterium]